MKDSIEEVRAKGKFSNKENLVWTLVIVMVCCGISCAFTSIGTVTTILGATTNSAIGFLLPVAFYLKVERKSSRWTNTKIMAYMLFVFICISSVITLTLVISKMINGDGDEKA
jgi:amino acid permease